MKRRLRDTELCLFVGYALIVFRPGARPPQHPQEEPPERTLPPGWSTEERQLYIAEAGRDMDQQHADKRDVRTRAHQVFTITLVLGAAIAAAYSSRHHGHHGLVGTILYGAAALFTALGGLASVGVITARSAIGGPNLDYLIEAPAGKAEERLVTAYAATRFQGAATVAVMVTVMRDAVLVLLLAFALFIGAYVWG